MQVITSMAQICKIDITYSYRKYIYSLWKYLLEWMISLACVGFIMSSLQFEKIIILIFLLEKKKILL